MHSVAGINSTTVTTSSDNTRTSTAIPPAAYGKHYHIILCYHDFSLLVLGAARSGGTRVQFVMMEHSLEAVQPPLQNWKDGALQKRLRLY
eukprot:1158843-Rhodomonas_salina.2